MAKKATRQTVVASAGATRVTVFQATPPAEPAEAQARDEAGVLRLQLESQIAKLEDELQKARAELERVARERDQLRNELEQVSGRLEEAVRAAIQPLAEALEAYGYDARSILTSALNRAKSTFAKND